MSTGEEVRCHQRVRVRSKELLPRQPCSPARRREARSPQHRPDGGRRDCVAELHQLTANTEVAPGRILLRHLPDQLPAFLRQRRSPHSASTQIGRPPSPHQLAIPAQHRLRCTNSPAQADLGSRSRSTLRISRSLGCQRTRFTCRSSTLTCWRRASTSACNALVSLVWSLISSMTRRRAEYRAEKSTASARG